MGATNDHPSPADFRNRLKWYILGKHSTHAISVRSNTECDNNPLDPTLDVQDHFVTYYKHYILDDLENEDSAVEAALFAEDDNIEKNAYSIDEEDDEEFHNVVQIKQYSPNNMEWKLLRDFEINIAGQDVEEQALIYITGYVAHRFRHKYPDLGTPTKILAPCDDWLSCISRGNCLYPSDEFMEAARVMNAEFLSFHGTSFFNMENNIFDKVTKKHTYPASNKVAKPRIDILGKLRTPTIFYKDAAILDNPQSDCLTEARTSSSNQEIKQRASTNHFESTTSIDHPINVQQNSSFIRTLSNTFQTETEVKTRRRSIKASATRLRTYIDSPQSEHATKFELVERKKKLSNLFQQYDEVQSYIECLDSESDDMNRISRFEPPQVTPQSVSSGNQVTHQNNTESQIKLPRIQLPVFSGAYEDWCTFHDLFDKLIHANANLSATQKFHYLRSSLKDKAAEIIKSFDITTDNYSEAWKLLNERFDNKKRIIQTHVKAMFEIPSIHKENYTALRNLLDNLLKHFRALRALQRPIDSWDDMMIHLVLAKLDSSTIKEWQTSRTDNQIPTFKELTDFLAQRCEALEATFGKLSIRSSSEVTNSSQKAKNPSSHASTSSQVWLKGIRQKTAWLVLVESVGKHTIRYCILIQTRLALRVQRINLHALLNQLTHPYQSLHLRYITQCTQINSASKIFLSTAIVNVYDCHGHPHGCRVLLDSGSQLNFITQKLANKLRLNHRALNMSICGVAEGTFESKEVVNISFRSRTNKYTNQLDCIILPKITQDLPQEFCPMSEFRIPSNIILADPSFNIPNEIDLLIGAQMFWQLVCVGQIKSCKAHPTLQKTKLGWVISGTIQGHLSNTAIPSCHITSVNELDRSLSRFWEIEHNVPCNEVQCTPDEQKCEMHFQANVTRNTEGRFVVKLPTNDDKIQQLGETHEIAKRRFLSLEKRLLLQPDVYAQYRKFMQEYIDLNHMRRIKPSVNHDKAYYMPHHPVFKETSTTTKLRVVFDASCKSTSGLSLNDSLLVGPTIQEDLFSILLRFRTFSYAMTADITKMYRQILFHDSKRSLQRIFWRHSPQNELGIYELLSLTYGTAPVSFLAIRTIRRLAEDEMNSYPIGSKIILRDFYVDDLLTGASTFSEALEIKKQTVELLAKGGFDLVKWSSNHAALQDSQGPHKKKFDLVGDRNVEARTLGVIWNCQADVFKFEGVEQHPPLERPTKCSILSRIALIFDPLGLLGPSVLIAKIIMQDLWRAKVDWDESISNELHTLWREYERKLQVLSNIEITRKVVTFNEIQFREIHGFSDASEQAYGACIYLRSISDDGHVEVHLLCSKSRVAPLKALSIPRLELCGALLLAQLTQKVLKCLPFAVDGIHLWTDSTIVTCWIRSCSRQWSQFVANRVAEIQRLTNIDSWKHVPSKENPADLLSRDIELPEGRATALVAETEAEQQSDIFEQFSKLSRIVRVIAFCQRFIRNSRMHKVHESHSNNKSVLIPPLSIDELEKSRLTLVKMVQRTSFRMELHSVKRVNHVNKNSSVLKLNPFIDEQGILRVGGRLRHADVSYEYKHPILLPGKHPFTKMIILHEHVRHFHAGAQATLSAIRQRYWPTSARSVIRSIINKCVICFRNAPKSSTPVMADLPESRVNTVKYAFEKCGVDYAGPYWYREAKNQYMMAVERIKWYFISPRAPHMGGIWEATVKSAKFHLKRIASEAALKYDELFTLMVQ
ncbi:PREDICTED: uncharacterized protein LOC108768190, partial [Trachymyrmex cornetzi]|uniref:uncharacterized protein LOC108768190 n=1 Tax=Trachymyrmex cornetzi TaxID=471704 RepID=UPI00084F62DC